MYCFQYRLVIVIIMCTPGWREATLSVTKFNLNIEFKDSETVSF